MVIEIIFWPNLYERYMAGLRNEPRDSLNTSRTEQYLFHYVWVLIPGKKLLFLTEANFWR